MSTFIEGKWQWMMDWCRKYRLSPANSNVWRKAEEEYNLAHPIPVIEPYVYCEAYQNVYVGTHEVEEFHQDNAGKYDDIAQGYVNIAHPSFSNDALIDYYQKGGDKPPFIAPKP